MRLLLAATLGALAVLVLGPGVALAAVEQAVVPMQQQAPAPAESLDAVLTNIRNWIMGIATALATVFLTVGAVRYMAAGGDLGEVEKAKTAFRSAGFGYAIAVLAPVLVGVLQGIVGA
ncbi:pilin [Pseudonocardia sp. HH130630-07]|uniref:pilin n=1 Tax=Pseudonocardia sp. HH130630-07 TaxID=1690815 RepID=UPI0012E9A15E|nr:pilin [Pseudonocardia sp. HH130630-07]